MNKGTRKKLFIVWSAAFLMLTFYFINGLFWVDNSLELKASPVLSSISSIEKALTVGGTITLEAQDIKNTFGL